MMEANPVAPTLENGEKSEETKDFCKIHTEEELCRYCRDCEKILCLTCLVDHSDHFVQTIEEVEPGFRQELREHVDKLKAKQNEIMAFQEMLARKEEEIDRIAQEALDEVDRRVEYMNELVKEAGEEAKRQCIRKLILDHLLRRIAPDTNEPDLDEPDLD